MFSDLKSDLCSYVDFPTRSQLVTDRQFSRSRQVKPVIVVSKITIITAAGCVSAEEHVAAPIEN